MTKSAKKTQTFNLEEVQQISEVKIFALVACIELAFITGLVMMLCKF